MGLFSYKIKFFLISLLFFSQGLASETTSTGSSSGTQGSGEFKNITVKEFADLDAFPENAPGGKIEGVVLECEQGENNSIGFCMGECSENVGNNEGAKISKEFANFIDEYMVECLKQIDCKKSAAFCGVGGHSKRKARNSSAANTTTSADGNSQNATGSNSRHSTGDAMDIGGLRCEGITLDFTAPGRSKNQDKYDKFTKCWSEQVAKAKEKNPGQYACGGCLSCKGSGETADSDGDHDDHIHISAPIKRPGGLSCK